ncbi:MAG TPA: MgtC/SapB family protein [Candidatus Gallimonas intestinavium]|uniref:MgtC/SapB family protein n=1 Tax=Candidatus Gallimonas intestinavium TaxID=2838603 RepID=A0A9D2G4J7_9FIRM|nr:MgtC/SapB family protein [Candidatus Gallimonas intestinavium]
MTEQLLGELHSLLNILLAVLLGFAIGYERKLRYKEAGIRTHTIVCVGSALIMVVSKYGFSDIQEYDASRVAAQIVSGIGFLGAGIIIYRKHEIHGLTTAAGVWATAGVGMAAGAGMYVVAAGAAVVIIGVQCIFHIKCRLFRTKKYFQVKICFTSSGTENDVIKELFQTDRFNRLVIERKGGETVYHATLNTDREYSSQKLSQIMTEHPFIRSIERCDED